MLVLKSSINMCNLRQARVTTTLNLFMKSLLLEAYIVVKPTQGGKHGKDLPRIIKQAFNHGLWL